MKKVTVKLTDGSEAKEYNFVSKLNPTTAKEVARGRNCTVSGEGIAYRVTQSGARKVS